MLTIGESPLRKPHACGRREFLRAGALGLGGLTLADVLRNDATAKTATRPKSLIYIVLSGGPSHIDMYDLKPEAPAEYRGPFTPISTSLPGEYICEHMPLQAQLLDRCALVRGIRSVENDHYLSEVYTGLPRTAGQRPAFGSVLSRLKGGVGPLPPYVSLAEGSQGVFDFELPHYAGLGHAPFRPKDESVEDLTPVKSLDQLQGRRQLLAAFDRWRQQADQIASYGAIDRFQSQALEIMTSSQVRDAFDLSREPADMLERYGHKQGHFTHQTLVRLLYPWDARRFVLARRLVEAGVRVVTVQIGAWDHHSGPDSHIFTSLQHMLPALDRSLAALFNDLHERGLDNDVSVVVLGEFGRTPKITYPGPGREHWADAGCALFYGGGLKMGQVIGATDSRAERSKDGKIDFQNVLSTVYHTLGIHAETQLLNFNGRPQSLLDRHEPIRALIA